MLKCLFEAFGWCVAETVCILCPVFIRVTNLDVNFTAKYYLDFILWQLHPKNGHFRGWQHWYLSKAVFKASGLLPLRSTRFPFPETSKSASKVASKHPPEHRHHVPHRPHYLLWPYVRRIRFHREYHYTVSTLLSLK